MATSPLGARARRWLRPLRRAPLIAPLVQRAVDRVGLFLWRRALRRRARAGTLNRFADRPISVDPRTIDSQVPLHALPLDGARTRDAVGWTLAGDWDLVSRPLAEHAVFQGIRQRFGEGRAWADTSLHAAAAAGLASGRPLWKFRTAADLPRLFEKIDRLHAAIAADGYRTQRELGSARLWDELMVAYDRNGRLHMVDGAHRLAIAQVLGLDDVPALVAACHPDWEGCGDER